MSVIEQKLAELAAIAADNGHSPNGKTDKLQIRKADLNQVQPFRWAWQDRLLLGYVNLLAGDEGVGKGTFIAWLIARLTRGDLPGVLHGHPVRVLMIGDEDGFHNITVPRLHTAGADLDLVYDAPIDDAAGPLDIRRDITKFKQAVGEGGFKIVVFDQLLDNLGVGVDDWKAKPVREAIGPLRRAAREHDIAVLAALHTNKSTTGGFRQRVGGSQQFNALSRSSCWLLNHPDHAEEDKHRVVLWPKANYANPGAVEFRITGHASTINDEVHHVGTATGLRESDITLEDVLSRRNGEPLTKADNGRAILLTELADGEWHPARDVMAMLEEHEIGEREANRLKTGLGVESHKDGFQGPTLWRLPRGREGAPDYRTSRTSRTAMDTGISGHCECEESLPRPAADGAIRCASCELLADWGAE